MKRFWCRIAQVGNAFREKEPKSRFPERQSISEYISALLALYGNVEDKEDIFLDPSTYSALSIRCDEPKLNDDGTYVDPLYPNFFDPLSLDRSHVHQIDWELMEPHKRHYDCFQECIVDHMHDPSDADQSVIGLCYEMDWVFGSYPRIGTNPAGLGLCWLTKW